MATLWALLFLLLLLLVLLLHVFSLPANWILLGLVTIWKLAHSETMPWSFVLILVGIAAFGELAEFIAQAYGAKRFGSTGRGNFGGILGAILGAIVGAPFFFRFGRGARRVAWRVYGMLHSGSRAGALRLRRQPCGVGRVLGEILRHGHQNGAGHGHARPHRRTHLAGLARRTMTTFGLEETK